MKARQLTLLFLTTLLSMSVHAEPYHVIDEYVEHNKRIIRLPSGTAIAVVKENEIVYEGYFGFTDIEQQVQVDADSVFYIASMTKAFYSLLTLMQEHDGKLATNWTLSQILPDAKFIPALHADKVTIRDLLSHTSGIDNWPLVQATAYTGQYDDDSLRQLITESYVNNNASYGRFEYTNVGYNILSHWMDTKFDQDWQSLLNSQIFSPLKMQHTSARMSDVLTNNWKMAKGYSVKSQDPKTPVYLRKTDKSMHAAGGMVSSARDLARFLLMQINLGKIEGQQVIPQGVIKKSHQAVANYEQFGRQRQYGWGWFIRNLFDQKLIEHRGGYAGNSTYMSFMPEQKVGLIVLSNQDKWGGDLAYAIEDIAYAIALGQSHEDVSKLVKDNQQLVVERAEKFYSEKKVKIHEHADNLDRRFVGTFQHATLGSITIKQDNKGIHHFEWGNLRSPIFKGELSHQLVVEVVPNSLQPVVFLTGSDQHIYLDYKEYRFRKTRPEVRSSF